MVVTGAAAALLLAVGCGSAGDPAGTTLRLLFLGNSLTYANDLPAMVASLADHAGDFQIEVTDASAPNYALEDHWNDPASMSALDQDGWDVVILQQGPSSLPENQVNLRENAIRFAERIRSRDGARAALYMVWPDVDRLSFFDDVSQSYRSAAQAADADLYPAGGVAHR
jgi:hypothetical protein